MDRLEAPVGHVITGLKLRLLGGHLNLEIQVDTSAVAFISVEPNIFVHNGAQKQSMNENL
jgi:hypothetical protein